MPLTGHHFVMFGEFESHHVLRCTDYQLLLHFELVMALAKSEFLKASFLCSRLAHDAMEPVIFVIPNPLHYKS